MGVDDRFSCEGSGGLDEPGTRDGEVGVNAEDGGLE